MKKSAQKIKATTQKFIEIQNIDSNIVQLHYGNACLIIEVQAANFSLFSQEEQNVKILSYSALLNSLSFPIQIFIQSKKIDITSYIKLLDKQAEQCQNELLKKQINLYRDFVQELVKVNTVLDKKFYIAISYSKLEGGTAKTKLAAKVDSLHERLKRMGLPAKTLNREDLVKLFHGIYNGDLQPIDEAMLGSESLIVKSAHSASSGQAIF